jgi:hypothetical protein
MTTFARAGRKAVATFLFASLGVLVGSSVFDAGWPLWQQASSVGIGAVLNLVYRWSEAVVREPITSSKES